MNFVSLFKFYLDLESLRLLLALHNQETVRILVYGGSNITQVLTQGDAPLKRRPPVLATTAYLPTDNCDIFQYPAAVLALR